MPRKPLDSEHETVTCTVRLRLSTRDRIDELRKATPRSEYIRGLIEQSVDIEMDVLGLRDEPAPLVVDPPTFDYQPKPVIKIVPEGRHLHRFIKHEQTGFKQGKPTYFYSCACGETKID